MLSNFSPMLAASPPEGFSWASFPFGPRWLASPKIDGVRVICHPELGPITRSLKPIPNRYVRMALAHPSFVWLDGEVVLDWNDPKGFGKTIGAVMSHAGRPRFQFCVFDWAGEPRVEYLQRQRLEPMSNPEEFLIRQVPQIRVETYEDFLSLEQSFIDQGFEGLMLRDAHARYKFGRSTWREKGLIKVKRYADAEGKIVDWKPLMRNHNEPIRNALGRQERSGDGAGLVPDPTRIGALVLEIVNGEFEGKFVDVGSGFTDEERRGLRVNIEQLIRLGALVTFKYLPHGGIDAPRHPIWKGLREKE